MRHMGLAWVAMVGVAIVGAPLAQAGVTCKVVPSWCPAPDKNHSVANNGSSGTSGSVTATKTSVPEPATLMLLAAGVSAVGVAVRRRRKD